MNATIDVSPRKPGRRKRQEPSEAEIREYWERQVKRGNGLLTVGVIIAGFRQTHCQAVFSSCTTAVRFATTAFSVFERGCKKAATIAFLRL